MYNVRVLKTCYVKFTSQSSKTYEVIGKIIIRLFKAPGSKYKNRTLEQYLVYLILISFASRFVN